MKKAYLLAFVIVVFLVSFEFLFPEPKRTFTLPADTKVLNWYQEMVSKESSTRLAATNLSEMVVVPQKEEAIPGPIICEAKIKLAAVQDCQLKYSLALARGVPLFQTFPANADMRVADRQYFDKFNKGRVVEVKLRFLAIPTGNEWSFFPTSEHLKPLSEVNLIRD